MSLSPEEEKELEKFCHSPGCDRYSVEGYIFCDGHGRWGAGTTLFGDNGDQMSEDDIARRRYLLAKLADDR